jgi:hypothetical protein
MRTLRTMLFMAALGALVASVVAPVAALALSKVAGTVSASDPSSVTVSGHRYVIDTDTEIIDRGGRRVAMKELVPGTPVELDIGDDGNLAVLRATLAR